MRNGILVFCFILSMPVIAKILDLKLSVKHRRNAIIKKYNSEVKVQIGKKFIITKDNIEAHFTAIENSMRAYGKNSKSSIEFKGKIYRKENGEKKLIASPHIISAIDEETSFSSKDSSGEEITVKISTNSLID